jgi:C1A family cysteine protease
VTRINGAQDKGSHINQALDLAVNQGISTLNTMPYSASDYHTQPSQGARSEAARFKLVSWSRVNDTSRVKAALANRQPVVGGINVYGQFMNLKGSDSVYNTTSGNSPGGYAITIVGYDDDRYGGAFKVITSWSQNWGDNGFFWMPYDFAAANILREADVLEDGENTVNPTPSPSVSPINFHPEPTTWR